MTVSKLAALLGVAEAALDVAKEYAEKQRAIAQRSLWTELGLLVMALMLASTVMVLVSRRVVAPLRAIEEAMAKVATGDFSVRVAASGTQG